MNNIKQMVAIILLGILGYVPLSYSESYWFTSHYSAAVSQPLYKPYINTNSDNKDTIQVKAVGISKYSSDLYQVTLLLENGTAPLAPIELKGKEDYVFRLFPKQQRPADRLKITNVNYAGDCKQVGEAVYMGHKCQLTITGELTSDFENELSEYKAYDIVFPYILDSKLDNTEKNVWVQRKIADEAMFAVTLDLGDVEHPNLLIENLSKTKSREVEVTLSNTNCINLQRAAEFTIAPGTRHALAFSYQDNTQIDNNEPCLGEIDLSYRDSGDSGDNVYQKISIPLVVWYEPSWVRENLGLKEGIFAGCALLGGYFWGGRGAQPEPSGGPENRGGPGGGGPGAGGPGGPGGPGPAPGGEGGTGNGRPRTRSISNIPRANTRTQTTAGVARRLEYPEVTEEAAPAADSGDPTLEGGEGASNGRPRTRSISNIPRAAQTQAQPVEETDEVARRPEYPEVVEEAAPSAAGSSSDEVVRRPTLGTRYIIRQIGSANSRIDTRLVDIYTGERISIAELGARENLQFQNASGHPVRPIIPGKGKKK